MRDGLRYTALALLLTASAGFAQQMTEKPLPVDGLVASNGTAIELSLAHAKKPRVGNVAIYRRKLGQSGAHTWQPLAPQLGPVLRYTDRDVTPGIPYEYQVVRSARDIVDIGYYTAGTEIPAVETRGKALVVIDDSIAADLALRLDRFERDLIGDGYEVIRHLTPRGTRRDFEDNVKQAAELRAWIQEQYFADPFARHVLILVGHVPMALSGALPQMATGACHM